MVMEFTQITFLPLFNLTLDVTNTTTCMCHTRELYLREVHTPWSTMYPAYKSNQGTVLCKETSNVSKNAVPLESDEYSGEAYLLGGIGKADITGWSPNRMTIQVKSDKPSTLIVNQNYDSGWRVEDRGLEVYSSEKGLIAVDLESDTHQIKLAYKPASFTLGLVITLLTAAGIIIYNRKHYFLIFH